MVFQAFGKCLVKTIEVFPENYLMKRNGLLYTRIYTLLQIPLFSRLINILIAQEDTA